MGPDGPRGPKQGLLYFGVDWAAQLWYGLDCAEVEGEDELDSMPLKLKKQQGAMQILSWLN